MERPYAKEAAQILYNAGLRATAQPFIERMLSVEARLAALELVFSESIRQEFATLRRPEIPPRESAMLAPPRGR